jgi:hypothetical protein
MIFDLIGNSQDVLPNYYLRLPKNLPPLRLPKNLPPQPGIRIEDELGGFHG